jgi:hypothetical protein
MNFRVSKNKLKTNFTPLKELITHDWWVIKGKR